MSIKNRRLSLIVDYFRIQEIILTKNIEIYINSSIGMNNQNGEKGRLLGSWKEIAEHLGFDKRTCLRWEKKLGLPIHRIDPESSRSRVFAYQEELDDWLRTRQPGSIPLNLSAGRKSGLNDQYALAPSKRPGRKLFWILAPLSVLMALAAFYFLLRPAGISQPVDFRIKGSALTILDAKGRALWSHDTGFEQLRDESYYRMHFQRKKTPESGSHPIFPHIIISDINKDGRVEVLFTAQVNDNIDTGAVICFDHKGRKLWQFEPGREMIYGPEHYSNDYWVQILDLCDLEGDGKKEVIVVADQIPFFPTQIVVLDAQGKVLGEYWNSGRIVNFAALDLDGDSRKELALGGKNNEYRKPCLFVLDPERMAGGSPQIKNEYRCAEIGPGTERCYLLFPQTEIDLIEQVSGDPIVDVNVLKNGNLSLWAAASKINYELTPRLIVNGIRLSDTFRKKFREYQAAGKIAAGELNETAFTKNLAKQILYFDGRGWTATPIVR